MNRRDPRPPPKPAPAPAESEPAGKPWLAVRPAKIETARKLIRDPNYPQRRIVDSVARLLAKHLRHS